MTNEGVILAVIDALEALHIPYMVVGSFALVFYGSGRATNSAEFVIQTDSESLASFMNYLGPGFRLNPQMMPETIAVSHRHVLEAVGISLQVDLFHLSDDPHDRERFRRRRRVKVLDRETNLPTAEDVIITKTRWAWVSKKRSKDVVDDVRAVLAVQGPNLDWPYIFGWCDRHGTRELLDEIRASIPPI